MRNLKLTLTYAFAIFGGIFGAGNLIIPPMIGSAMGKDWWLGAIGFLITAVLVPYLALLVFSKEKTSLTCFGECVSKRFGTVFGLMIFVIALSLPIPRTAAVTHEISIAPFFGSSALLTSTVYFSLVMVFAINRKKVVSSLGSYLTPLLIALLICLVVTGLFSNGANPDFDYSKNALVYGLLEGYQTYDALGGIVAGSVVALSIKSLRFGGSEPTKAAIYKKAAFLAMLMLLIIYLSLIMIAAFSGVYQSIEDSRTGVLNMLIETILGNVGQMVLAILMALACFTTAISVVVGAGDFASKYFKESRNAYLVTVIAACSLGILMGQLEVEAIIRYAVPLLLLLYPVTIVLIGLNLLPSRMKSKKLASAAVITALVFSAPSALEAMGINGPVAFFQRNLPFVQMGVLWTLPVMLVVLIGNLKRVKRIHL